MSELETNIRPALAAAWDEGYGAAQDDEVTAYWHEGLTQSPVTSNPYRDSHPESEGCRFCWACLDAAHITPMGYVLCGKCGNKRCPHAADHRLECTRSNAPGQPGATRYPDLPVKKEES
jgi:hypothetical protein